MIARERGEKQHGISAGRPLKWRLRRACSPNEAWRAWQRSRFARTFAEIFECEARERRDRRWTSRSCFVWKLRMG